MRPAPAHRSSHRYAHSRGRAGRPRLPSGTAERGSLSEEGLRLLVPWAVIRTRPRTWQPSAGRHVPGRTASWGRCSPRTRCRRLLRIPSGAEHRGGHEGRAREGRAGHGAHRPRVRSAPFRRLNARGPIPVQDCFRRALGCGVHRPGRGLRRGTFPTRRHWTCVGLPSRVDAFHGIGCARPAVPKRRGPRPVGARRDGAGRCREWSREEAGTRVGCRPSRRAVAGSSSSAGRNGGRAAHRTTFAGAGAGSSASGSATALRARVSASCASKAGVRTSTSRSVRSGDRETLSAAEGGDRRLRRQREPGRRRRPAGRQPQGHGISRCRGRRSGG